MGKMEGGEYASYAALMTSMVYVPIGTPSA